MQSVLLSTAYLPSVEYIQKIKNVGVVFIEKHEHYQKQSYRNRCNLLTANGLLSLSIPIIQTHQKELITETKISYVENWQHQHWRAIESAYRNSPYFIYYADALKLFYQKKYTFLFDFNAEILQMLLRFLKINTEIKFTENYDTSQLISDYRNSIHPKNKGAEINLKPYSQLFSDKFPFQENLSCIDLLFNQGNYSSEFL